MNLVYGCKSLFSRILKHFQPQLQGMEVVKANGSASLAHGISAEVLWWDTKSGLPKGIWQFRSISDLRLRFSFGRNPPQKLVLPGYLVVFLLVPSGFALLCYSWWEKKRHSGKEREVISARFADVWMLGNILSNSGKRCGNVVFTEIMDRPVMWYLVGFFSGIVLLNQGQCVCRCVCLCVYVNIYCTHMYILYINVYMYFQCGVNS